jgi:hypothetical protein
MAGLLADVVETLPQPQGRLAAEVGVRGERLSSLTTSLAVQRLKPK